MACGILVPQPGMESMPPCSGSVVLTTGLPRKYNVYLVLIDLLT